MTKLEQLIKNLCPNGVEYKKLGEVATISRGGSFQKKDFCENGVPCIHYGQIYTRYGLFADKTLTFISEEVAKKQKFAVKNDIVMAVTSENIDDVCKCIAWLGEDNIAVSGHSAIIHHTLNPKYLCYYFHTAMFFAQKVKLAHGTKVIEVSPSGLADITIPVPALEVQAEIVKILDEYTESVTALQQELEKELTARKKQYEYYRDLLLDFGVHGGGASECEWRTLGEICKFYNGDRGKNYPSHSDYREKGIPFINAGDLETGIVNMQTCNYISEEKYNSMGGAKLRNGDIIYCLRGSIGKNGVFQGEQGTLASSLVAIRANDTVCGRYIYYLLNSSMELRQRIVKDNGAAQPNLSAQSVKNYLFPIPPIEEQERIVSILDRFDKLCNDISEGLPAEIEARRKQYEYYRDKLLSFEEVKM